ncbi:MAG: N-acetyl-gamma-glutamyl-phosphate reductase [Oscillospiraceae bacterium]|nr:N-acetyl-gamma-glutamyl-phosphate reductase [Oscillospiraceae bacterium]
MRVFIDGESGTVGLNIRERLNKYTDIELLKIDPELSENADERKKFLNRADIAFLCLPDEIAKESVALIDSTGNITTRIIDASTAHRTHPDWTYGFPELSKAHEEQIRTSKRVATPGCYASGFIALVYPLVSGGLLSADSLISCFGISGYSGAGKAFIDEYQGDLMTRNPELASARLYALAQSHKHQPEMRAVCGLTYDPMFNPVIDDYYSGMIVNIPLMKPNFTACDVRELYKKHYSGTRVELKNSDVTFLAANTLAGSDGMELYVFSDPNSERILLSARFDNLGKGASGAAVQCFEIMQK